MQIARHEFDSAASQALFARSESRFRQVVARGAPVDTLALSVLGNRALNLLGDCSVFDRQHDILRLAARILAQARLGLVLLGTRERGATADFPIGEVTVTMTSAGPEGLSDIGRWQEGWYGALIAREAPAFAGLRAINPDRLRECADLDEYHYAWRRALLALDSAPAESVARVESALLLTDPAHATIAKPGVPGVAAKMFAMLPAIVERDAARFNATLAGALEAHKAFWGEETPHGSISWFSLPAQAMCCLAHDRGIRIEVESDYLLPALFAPPR